MEIGEKIEITVIIPVYNTGKYLRRCIDSVLNSKYKNFEIILVNDGSTDNSEEICRYYNEKDCRVRLLNQKNCGVSAARNNGIDISSGKWIVFVDSDDVISGDFLGMIVQEENQNQDLLIFEQVSLNERLGRNCSHKDINDIQIKYYLKKEDIIKVIEKMLMAEQLTKDSKISLYSPCAKAYRKSILDRYSIRFPVDIFIGEDKIFNIEYLTRTETCLYIPQIAYFVQWRPESATHCFHKDFLKNHYAFQKQLENILKKNMILKKLERAYYENILAAMTEVLIYGIFNPNSSRTYGENCILCHKVRNEKTYKQAIKCNGVTGIVPRRILLLLLNVECYPLIDLMCKLSYIILYRTRKK